jgi:uncharacterized membrane protein
MSHKRVLPLLGLSLFIILLQGAGLLALVIGMAVTIPVAALMMAIYYQQIKTTYQTL